MNDAELNPRRNLRAVCHVASCWDVADRIAERLLMESSFESIQMWPFGQGGQVIITVHCK